MSEKKLSYKLLNILLIFGICFLFYNTMGLWKDVFKKIFAIITPFAIAFVIAYALYPFLRKLQRRGVRKSISITLMLVLIIGFFIILISLLIPIIAKQIGSFSSFLLAFVQDISTKYNIDLNYIQENITDINSIVNNYGKPISDFSFQFISCFLGFLSKFIICFISSIYFLISMDVIRSRFKKYLKLKSKKTFNYFKRIDYEVSQYFVGLEKFIVIQFIEYTLIFLVIGHPYYLLLGILCAVTTIIPYFGGIFSNVIASVTAFFISPKLFVLTLIVTLVFPNIDGYIISPRVYGKTNNVPALATIFAVFAGGILYGIGGIVIALPLTIVLIATYRYFEDDINDKIEELKSQK